MHGQNIQAMSRKKIIKGYSTSAKDFQMADISVMWSISKGLQSVVIIN